MFDVAIIGAGPAGTAAAFDLLDKDLTVLILDKYEFPRKKACAGGITPKCFKLFQYDISKVIQRTCYSVRVTPPSGTPFIIENDRPLCYMTDRKDLDAFSLQTVIKKGAEFNVVKEIDTITEHDDRVEIISGSDRFEARYLIGADGANSRVRQILSNPSSVEKQLAVEANVRIDHPEQYPMEFDFSQRSKGYYWIFPKGNHLNIGIYGVDSEQKVQTEKLSAYAEKRFGTDQLEDIKGYPICTGGFDYTPDARRIFLVGDAAGMAERLLGEGIYFAVKTAQLAADAILKTQWTGLPALYTYTKNLKRVQQDLKLHHLASDCLYLRPDIAFKILSIPLLRRSFVIACAAGRPLSDMLTSPASFFNPKN